VGDGFSVQGNILAGEEVIEAMARAFENVNLLARRVVIAEVDRYDDTQGVPRDIKVFEYKQFAAALRGRSSVMRTPMKGTLRAVRPRRRAQ